MDKLSQIIVFNYVQESIRSTDSLADLICSNDLFSTPTKRFPISPEKSPLAFKSL